MIKKAKTKLMTAALLMSGFLALATGCQSTQQPSMYNSNMNKCTESVKAGDLAVAKQYVSQAKLEAVTFDQKRQVESMEKLIEGAEALMEGKVETAKVCWSNIPDPQLCREVRVKAKTVMDLEIPATAVRKEN